ncbi:DUF3775 domain-containing protein [Reyranella sp.]|uniref:DUF3775 domain-containing protein n=1 Tax=Reyranella sp. TaxID=1929291 RepID=UPI003D0F0C0F
MPELSISSEKVCFLIVKAREFDVQDVDTELEDGANATDDGMIDVLEDSSDNPVEEEIRVFIAEMDEDEKADLIGLLRLGRGDGTMEEWAAMRAEDMREHAGNVAAYLLGEPMLGDYLEEGLSQFGMSCTEFEIGRL